MKNQILSCVSGFFMFANIAILLATVYLTRVGEISGFPAYLVMALTVTGTASAAVSAIHYEEK